ncbi:hypothetical protein CBR_g31148 [Chara braunii]|uniref:CCHC-type domain-containing protein n=1 Tax=Chara braunii TaxID=69332 RepID=A0A388LEF5_CHABU|nr:hypothetical protein CBR_g31148 [Chara braunii]|eukprot:GBG80689.1 hypothetical protein CBR_g31148 [Chara braunii]
MAGHGDNCDFGGGGRNLGGGGREYGGHRDYERGGYRGYGSDRGDSGDRGHDGDRRAGGERSFDRGLRRGPLICFNCDEPDHYANQCPHLRRNGHLPTWTNRGGSSPPSRPSLSRWQQSDPLESKVAEIGKSVAAVCRFVELEQQKNAAKERRKAERKEAEERAEAERAATLLSKQKKEEKARKEAEIKEELHKSLDVRMVVRVGELRDDVREDVRQEIREAIGELCLAVSRGKQKKVDPAVPAEGSSASSSEAEELNLLTRRLSISEKRNRGPEVVFEGSPPMEVPPKRTPKRGLRPTRISGRLTRSKARMQKTITPRKMSPSIRKNIPAAIGIVGRLKFEKRVLSDLKNLDALVLQNICKDEGIPYNGKFEAIFDIAAHRTHVAYGTNDDEDTTETPVVCTEVPAEAEEVDENA